ncbi:MULTISPECIES: acyl-CoA thioesterase [unclassified Leifsonia]|uniref:acyl-CoA thioesterase n=1 Tax=unclassified Leifsonia TaxID=2663824 RepID=UPI0007003D57|nr:MULTISPECIES: acyl-CoA thioesterase II [unclassified Leifsonia]KQX07131.1 acyl-CoA thioesterase II [Leifsonia sp. Root1293]KRA11414.1 acyl-CoA thioesterase II [Leifsonia sp. Root60]
MTNPIDGLLDVLDLVDTGARTEEDIFTGPSQWMPHGRVFGGQVLAQSVVAAGRTVPDDRAVHSMHGYFLRPGDVNLPITFSVDRIHDGRSFATRRTQAYQNGVPILSMIASFQDPDAGVDHQIEMPSDIPDAESLPTTADLIGHIDHDVARYWSTERAFDVRHVESPIFLSVEGERVAHQAVWMKAAGTLPDDDRLHRAALAYATDYSILESPMRRHGVPWAMRGLRVASLDHAMWWHRPGRVDEWMLYVQDSPSASGGRGLARGSIFSADGVLLASVAQEGMIRVPDAR